MGTLSPKDVPILLNIFNRPEKVTNLLGVLRSLKPKYLYVSCDGPRKNILLDEINIKKSKDLIEGIDWECLIVKRYSSVNLGCSICIPNAIDWFFENVEMGIILEDDCIPNLSFFSYCLEMLHTYKDVKEVMHISGTNLNEQRGDASYYFSKYGQIWGWATWRDRWKMYDKTEEMFLPSRNFFNRIEEQFWLKNFKYNIWDVRWAVFSVWKNNGISIIPNANLVSNIGFGKDATHYKDENSLHSNLTQELLRFPLKHPLEIYVDRKQDVLFFMRHYYKSKFQIACSKLFASIRKLKWN
jgi:hypothetical protein